MPIDVQMPDGTIISGVPDNITQADLLKRYQAYAPPKVSAGAVPDELGRYDAAKQPIEGPPVVNPQSGGMAALAGSTQQIQADITRLAGKLGIKNVDLAEREAKQYEAEKKRIYKPTEKGWSEDPLGNLSELAMGSVPYLAAPVAAGVAALALPEVGLAGGLIGTADLVAGAVSAVQFTGSNLSRDVAEGQTLKEASLLKAGAASIPQAALDVVGLKMLPGIRQIFTKAGVEVSEKALEEVAKKGLLEQAGYYTLQTGKTMTGEGLTEAGQAVFERLQAGLNIADEDARKEYFENFVGGAILGGAFSVPGHAYEAIKGKKPEQVIEESKDNLEKSKEEEQKSQEEQQRYEELKQKAEGTVDQVVTDENGNEQIIKGEEKQYLNSDEQKEYQQLRDKFEKQEQIKTEENVAQEKQTGEVIEGGQDRKAMEDELNGKDITEQEQTIQEKPIEQEPIQEKEIVKEEEAAGETLAEEENKGIFGHIPEKQENAFFEINKRPEQIHDEIKNLKSGEQITGWLVSNAPNEAAKYLSDRVMDTVKKLTKAGIPIRSSVQNGAIKGKAAAINLKENNNQANDALAWAQAIFANDRLSHYQVRFNGLDVNGKAHRLSGLDYATVLHEMLHVVTQAQLWAIKSKKFKGDKSIYKDILDIKKAIQNKYLEESKKPKNEQHPFMLEINRYLHVKNIGSTGKPNFKIAFPDELISHGMTNHVFQDFLAQIKMGKKTALDKLMEIFRKLLGVNPEYETALDRLTGVTNRFFDMTPKKSNSFTEFYGKKFGPGFTKPEIPIKTNTAGFKRFFKKSKVVDDNGKPKIVYHGTASDFNVFNKEEIGKTYGIDKEGFFFTARIPTAETAADDAAGVGPLQNDSFQARQQRALDEYNGVDYNDQEQKPYDYTALTNRGQNIMPVYLSLQNPLIITAQEGRSAGSELENGPRNLIKEALDGGHDGLIIKGRYRDFDRRAWVNRDRWDKPSDEEIAKQIKSIEKSEEETHKNDIYYVVFEPNQIKSAIGNTGEFDINNPDITKAAIPSGASGEGRNYKGQPVQASWSFPEDNIKHWYGLSDEKVDNIIYKLQDKQIDTKRAQQMIEKEVGKIDDDLNVYDKEQLYHGRTATGIREFLLNELMPAIKELQKLGLSPQEMREYLHNRHAEERNNKMNEINKLDPVTGKERKTPWELQDRASGIATADAQAYLAGLDSKKKTALEKVANMFDKMVKETQAILVQSGAESKETVDTWNSTYEHYVPLFRVEENFAEKGGFGSTGASKGFGTRGRFSKRAMGSEKEVQDILGNLIAQRERALIRAEKIRVGKALYALALKNPNPDLWLPVNPDAIKNKEALIAELQGLGFKNAAEIANNLMEEPKSRYISKSKKIDPDTGLPTSDTEESVKLKIDQLARFGDNVFPIRINGKDRYIFFNQENPTAVRMVASLQNLDADSLGDIEGVIGRMTRWFASVNTQYNPIFGAVNLLRDVQGAMFNLSTTPLAGQQGKVSSGIIPAMRGIMNVLRDERKGIVEDYSKNKWAEAFQEFRKEGGQTGYRESLIRTDETEAIIEKELGKIKEGNVKKAFGAVMGALTDFNDMMENSVRVSAYVAALDKGLSKQQAAIIAKNLTVNFDKKGQLSARINAYYAFFNASVQGTARLAQTLKGPMGRKIIAGGIGLGAMQAVMLAAAGYREDEPPEFVRERNFVIPMPDGKYLSIPYPLGLHILPNVGRITTEFVLGGGKNGGKKVANMTGAFMDAFSPVGSSGLSIQSVLPTVLDPIAALESNKDAFGRPIYREDRATNPMPGYMRSRESASEISKQISYFLNLASGGGKYSKGFLSPTADELDYIAGQVTGGVGRELIKTEQAIKAGVTGEELPTYRIPLAGRFIGDTESKAAESQRFYGNITRMADHEHEVKGRQKNKENVMEYYREHPEARFWQMANNVENQINALNKQKKEFQEKGLPKERIQRIDNQKAAIMKRFNDHIAKYEE